MNAPITVQEVIDRWDSGDGKPYKGSLIDWDAYEQDSQNIGCMCAQGQVLALAGGKTPEWLRSAEQGEADAETARLLNISRAHAILLRYVNDSVDGAPSIVLTEPEKVLGSQWSKLLDFWWLFDNYSASDWQSVAAARDAARVAARVAAWVAAWDAARVAAGVAAREIQGFKLLKRPFFLPMFGIQTLDDIPARPADYGFGVVPGGAA